MFTGDIYVQPWAPHSSTESRLICTAQNELVKYDNLEYEEKFFHHNDVVRIE
jgi:cap2 methyltransferase